MFANITIIEWLTVAALIAGPVIAVLITRYWDGKREANRRKWEIFRNLMCYRKHPTSQRFVSSLNLLEVEFHDDKDVLEAWNSMYDHFCNEEPIEDNRKKVFYDKGEKLRADLLQKVAHSLGIELNSLDMLQSGYSPQGWGWDEAEQWLMRRKLSEVLEGTRPFPVHISNIPNNQDGETSENP